MVANELLARCQQVKSELPYGIGRLRQFEPQMTESTSTQAALVLEPVLQAFRQASGRWKGCDWPTALGQRGLNVEGLRAAQVLILARATSGREGDDCWDAALWLSRVEEEAREAENNAALALSLVGSGNLVAARECARRACAIEARYHRELVWQALYQAIEAAITSNGSEEGTVCSAQVG